MAVAAEDSKLKSTATILDVVVALVHSVVNFILTPASNSLGHFINSDATLNFLVVLDPGAATVPVAKDFGAFVTDITVAFHTYLDFRPVTSILVVPIDSVPIIKLLESASIRAFLR